MASLIVAYRKALERIYTLIGKEFALVVIAVNPEWTDSNAAARELLLVARSVSSEGKPDPSIRQVIRGPVVRFDVLSDSASEDRGVNDIVVLKPEDIRNSFSGRTLPPGTPLVVALVGVKASVITGLSQATCEEQHALASLVTGGYLVLSYTAAEDGPPRRLSHIDICEKPKHPTAKRGESKAGGTGDPQFLVGEESVDPTRSMTYAIRVQPVAAVPPRQVTAEVARPDMRAVRAPRWQPAQEPVRTPVAPPRAAAAVTPAWEALVASVVEREVSKIITAKVGREEAVVIQLGDGLVARIWPEMVHAISKSREWTAVFTHQSVNPTPRANYEAFETLGDKVLSLSLVHYLLSTTDPTRIIDSNGLTDSHKDILSKVRQPAMAVMMGLNERGLIRSTVAVDDQMLEDIQEAFFGCLFTVANRVAEGGNQGLPICEALFRHILHATFPHLDPWAVPKDPQTTLDQIFIKLGWGHPQLAYNEETRVTTIRLTRDAHAFLETVGPPIKNDKPLAVGPRTADKQSSARASAEIALAALKLGWGIDSRYASIMVRTRLMRDERYARVQREALTIAEKMGFVDIYVARRAKNRNQLYAVMGVRPDDSEAQLHIYKYENLEGRAADPEDDGGGLSTRIAAYITALRGFIGTTH